VTVETHQHAGHAGHADVVGELVDVDVRHREGNDNLAPGDDILGHEYRVITSRRSPCATGALSAPNRCTTPQDLTFDGSGSRWKPFSAARMGADCRDSAALS